MLSATQGFTYNKFEKPNDWPKLKDTFDYQYENGKLVGGNEHLYLSGPVTYTKVGNPTIKDNIVSGFTTTQYVFANSVLDTSQDFEIFTQVHTGNDFGIDLNTIFRNAYGTNPGAAGFAIGISTSTEKLLSYLIDSNGTSIANGATGQTTFQANTDYIIRFEQKGYTINLYSSSDYGETWVLENTWTSSAKIRNSGQGVSFGAGNHSLTNQYFRGSIDLNETYIKVNGKLWFYGKNYTTKNMVPVPAGLEYNNTTTPSIGWVNTNTDRVKGPVEYTVVGNPTIVNGVASGFNSSNYLSVNIGTWDLSANVYEVEISLPNATRSTSPLYICGLWVTLAGGEAAIVGPKSGGGNGYYAQVLNTFNVGDDIKLKIKYALNNFEIRMSVNGGEYGGFKTFTDIPSSTSGSILTTIGTYLSYVYTGSIDLNNTYIKVNGQPWFGNCPSEFQQFTPAIQGTMIGKDDSNMLQVESKNNIGSVGYSVVGSPTIQDNILVGPCTNQNFLRLASSFDLNNNCEFLFRLKPGKTYPGGLFFAGNYGQEFWLLFYYSYLIASFGSSQTIKIDGAFSTDTYYSIRLRNIGNTFYLGYLNNDTWTEQSLTLQTIPSAFSYMEIGAARYQSVNGYDGDGIDLDKSYIKVNDQVWFGTLPAEPKLVGPVDYTVVGSPTITDGVVSGFSDSDYIRFANNIPSIGNGFEMQTKFTTGETISSGYIGLPYIELANPFTGSAYGAGFLLRNIVPEFEYGRNKETNEEVRIKASFQLAVNTTYWFKAKTEDDILTFSYSLNGQTYTIIGTADLTLANIQYRTKDNSKYYCSGSVSNSIYLDLKETYIKVNGKLWFGKENWTPSTYTDNSIYLFSGHKSDYSQYNELGFTPIIETDSDELGSYNVWVDNQKIRSNMSQGTHIDWSKLDLTTGYSITTPSSLKAHTIKIEPTNDSDKIIGFHSFEEDSDESI